MSHSYLDYKDKFLRVHDGHAGIFFQFLSRKGIELYGNDHVLRSYFENWTEDKIYHGPGALQPNMEKFLINKERVMIFRNLLSALEEEFKSFGEVIPKDYLNNFFNAKPPFHFQKDYPVQNQIELIRDIRKFLDENESAPFPEPGKEKWRLRLKKLTES